MVVTLLFAAVMTPEWALFWREWSLQRRTGNDPDWLLAGFLVANGAAIALALMAMQIF